MADWSRRQEEWSYHQKYVPEAFRQDLEERPYFRTLWSEEDGSVNHFLAEHCISHSPERVLAGEESLGSMPFVLEAKDEYGRYGLTVFSLSPISCNAGHSYIQ
jgi:hypothetical protein